MVTANIIISYFTINAVNEWCTDDYVWVRWLAMMSLHEVGK